MTKKEDKLVEQEEDPVQQQYEREALQEQAKLEKKTEKASGKAYAAEEEMPQRFFTGGATYDEKAAWLAEHGGPEALGVVEPGHAEPEAKDVAPE
jgi:hypothetical protein